MSKQLVTMPALRVEIHYVSGIKEMVLVEDDAYIMPNVNDGILVIHDIEGDTWNIPYCSMLRWVECWSDSGPELPDD